MAELKQVILVRHDLKLPKGKLSAQVAHASVEAVLKSEKDKVKEWRTSGQKKVVLKAIVISLLIFSLKSYPFLSPPIE